MSPRVFEGNELRSNGNAATARPRILWIDDEVRPDDPLLHALRLDGIGADVAGSGSEGMRKAQEHRYTLIIVDLKLPDVFGLTVLQRLVASDVRSPVLVASGCYLEPEVDDAALRLGAAGILHKPFTPESIRDVVLDCIARKEAMDEKPAIAFHGIVGSSAAIREIVRWVERVAHSNASVLLFGETGTGKEVVAQAIHRAGPRQSAPFVAVNCGAIPDTLFESEMFGYRKGAFSGALCDKPGLLEAANNGTLFLDEVGELPLSMQVRILRSLEGGRVRRLGDARERQVDTRVIAATNRRLADEMLQGRFRSDLYYRLSALSYEIPPLRDRPSDVEALAHHWLRDLAQADGNAIPKLCADALAALRAYAWPGNVRELRNVLARASCFARGSELTAQDVRAAIAGLGVSGSDGPPSKVALALAALEANGQSYTKAAKSLGIGRTTLWRWLSTGRAQASHAAEP